MKRYLLNILIALSQLGNTILAGYPDETISARSFRLQESSSFWSFCRKIIDIIFFFDPKHCETSAMSEKYKKHLPKDYE